MQKYLLTFSMLIFAAINLKAQAPSYTDFEWDILRIGYVAPVSESELTAGISFGGELRFNLKDNFSIGLSSQTVTFDVKEVVRNESGKAGRSYTLGLVGDYYLNTTSSKRAFFGAGVHLQSSGEFSFDKDGVTQEVERASGTSLGARVGYEYSHLRLLANYNYGLKEGLSNYISISLAITLWGGYNG